MQVVEHLPNKHEALSKTPVPLPPKIDFLYTSEHVNPEITDVIYNHSQEMKHLGVNLTKV
jgi:hypothetical protein